MRRKKRNWPKKKNDPYLTKRVLVCRRKYGQLNMLNASFRILFWVWLNWANFGFILGSALNQQGLKDVFDEAILTVLNKPRSKKSKCRIL